MKFEPYDIEVKVTEKGYAVYLSKKEMQMIQCALGKVDFEVAAEYFKSHWIENKNAEDKDIHDAFYNLYSDFYDVQP